MDARTVTCVVTCKSAEILRRSAVLAKRWTDHNETVIQTIRRFPGGVEETVVYNYRLGDYFDSIELQPGTMDEAFSFQLVFRLRRGVESGWQYLVMAVLRAITDAMPGASVTSIRQPT
jgi:hypothetical protein